jgi:thiol:disulfide interchange protein
VKQPPNLVVTLGVAALAFAAIVTVKHVVTDKPRPWLTDEAAAFAEARADQKHVLIDFSATWSVPSDQMSRALDDLQTTIDQRYVRLRIDISDGALGDDEMRTRYGVTTFPAVVMVSTDGRVLGRITRMLDAVELRAIVR